MNKTRYLFICFFILLPLAACAAQQIYGNQIVLENSCGVLLSVDMENISDADMPKFSLEIPVDQKVVVGMYFSASDKDRSRIPANYMLTLAANGNTKTIKHDDLLKLLEGVKPEGTRYKREWVIKNKAVCPEAASNEESK